MEYAVGFLKPDCILRGLTEAVYKMMEAQGLTVILRKRIVLGISQITSVYYMCVQQHYFDELCEYLQSGPVEVYVVTGDGAIERLNRIVGEQGSANPSCGTIRATYATSPMENVLHSTSDLRTHNREVMILLDGDGRQFKNG